MMLCFVSGDVCECWWSGALNDMTPLVAVVSTGSKDCRGALLIMVVRGVLVVCDGCPKLRYQVNRKFHVILVYRIS